MNDSALPLIIALDPGRRCGFAIGRAGEIPRSGVVILRGEKEGREVGCGNLIAWLDMTLRSYTREELSRVIVVYEEPWSLAAWMQNCLRIGRAHNGESLESSFEIAGIIKGMCQRYGVRREPVRRQSVLKGVTGTSKHGSREKGKLAVIQAMRAMGLVEPNCKDDDRCDAGANFVYASLEFCRKQVGRPSLFGATA